jgi:hypothetical protein
MTREQVVSVGGGMTTLAQGQLVHFITHGESLVRRLLEHHKGALEEIPE